MSAALVGSRGPVAIGLAAAAVSPTWGASEARTAGNLLVCWIAGMGSATAPGVPSGWTAALGGGASNTAVSQRVIYRIATGADAAPTIAGVASTVLAACLAEFSGLDSAPADTGNFSPGGATAQTATMSRSDLSIGDLVLGSYAAKFTVGSTVTLTASGANNGASWSALSTSGVTTANHYWFGYGINTSAGSPDTLTLTPSPTTNISDNLLGLFSFKLPAVPLRPQIILPSCVPAMVGAQR